MPLTLVTPTQGRSATDTPPPSPAADRGRSWLARLFAGDFAFPAVAPVAVPLPGRTAAEADALSRALGCRDLFVIDAIDRSVRERVIAELARAAAVCGERVLALSPDSHAADRITEHIAAGEPLKVIRALAADENPHRLPTALFRLTSAEVGSVRVERMRREAIAEAATLEPKLLPLRAAADALVRMRELVVRVAEFESERDALSARRDRLETEVRDEVESGPGPGAFAELIAKWHADHEAATARPAADHAAAVAARREKEAALADGRKHLADAIAEADHKPGFFARLFGKSKPHFDLPELERQIHTLETELAALLDQEAKRKGELDAAASATTTRRGRLIAAEVGARRADIEARLAAVAAERERVAAEFRDQIPFVFGAGFGVVTPDIAAVERVSATVLVAKSGIEGQLAAAREQVDELTRDGAGHARRLLAEVQLVIGTPGSLDADPVFDTPAEAALPFGLLILDHAEQLTEPDFANLSRLAERWVLIGDAGPTHRPPLNGAGSHAPHQPRPTFVARLARLLDREPWVLEGDRLVCRLAHLTADQRRTVTREPVFDHPHIELRVATDEAGQGVLAEVAFPINTSVADAKRFLFRELDTVLLRPFGECAWHRSDDRLMAHWPAAEAGASGETWVELEPGVQEKVVGAGPAAFTAAVAFEVAAGWDAQKAEAWLASRLPAPSPGRLAVLPRAPLPHPARPVSVG
ncbi:MAG TPA: hypothetical protein VKE74_31985 [Gemmataceae bacterium]|nr:hypothetical protein [Gemmataceae bacterium]